jgi:hypothetical protein
MKKNSLPLGSEVGFSCPSQVANGLLAQLVERLNGIEEVSGSNPLGSTTFPRSREWYVGPALNAPCLVTACR